jgi:epoxyqueuosine reductase
MADISQEVKSYAKDKGADLVGIASVDYLNENAPVGRRPKDILPEARSTIVVGFRWVDSIVDSIPQLRGVYSRFQIVLAMKMDMLTFDIARWLTDKGFIAMPIPMGVPYSLKALTGIVSNKHAAVAAGIGEFGLNNLVLTPKFGARQRFGQIYTDAQMEYSKSLNLNICKNMMPKCKLACIKECPIQCIPLPNIDDDKVFNKIRLEGHLIDKVACSYNQDHGLPSLGRDGGAYRCGQCIKSCPVGSDVQVRKSILDGFKPSQVIP